MEYYIVMVSEEFLVEILGDKMTNISEEVYDSSFFGKKGSEEIPAACRMRAKYGNSLVIPGFDSLTQIEAAATCSMADNLGHWLDDENKPYHPKCDEI